ncbi:MAG: conserved membrane protein of unknown function [Promethearchaeota archaeon]|jgi:hypothetical protein|nr:MAG: conserved membrane protein of unknown function [Candidatus Lokiarchaeota archaeon]
MSEEMDREDWTFVKLMIQKHWKAGLLFVVLAIIAIIGAILTLFFHINNSLIGAGGTWTLAEFSIQTIIFWFLWLLLWEVLFVVIPTAAVMGGLGYFWWTRLEESEKELFREREKKEQNVNKPGAASGVLGFFVFIAFIIITIIDGRFDAALGTVPYIYWITTWFWSVFWILIFLGIPGTIGGLYYLRKKLREV